MRPLFAAMSYPLPLFCSTIFDILRRHSLEFLVSGHLVALGGYTLMVCESPVSDPAHPSVSASSSHSPAQSLRIAVPVAYTGNWQFLNSLTPILVLRHFLDLGCQSCINALQPNPRLTTSCTIVSYLYGMIERAMIPSLLTCDLNLDIPGQSR